MGGITLADLSPEVREIVDTEAPEGACTSDQPVCDADPRVTAQLTDDPSMPQVLPWRLADAQAGDLLMTPGGPSGLIGGMLSTLRPPQRFSHMAIVLDDGLHVRHATSVPGRMDLFFQGSILGLHRAPTDGIAEDALRYQWPGTVTQSVEQAFRSWRDHPYERDGDGEPKKDHNDVPIPSPGFGHLDEGTGSSFLIDALGFGPVPDPDRPGELLWPVLVTACPDLDTTAAVQARSRIADAARDIRGHYRLYAYTRGDIAEDPDFDGPTAYEATVRDPACSGKGRQVPVERSQALVCSTIVWAAAQLATRRGLTANPPLPRIVLDGRPTSQHRADHWTEACDEHASRTRQTGGGILDWGIPDGMYLYPEPDRQETARWLHDDYMVPYVRDQIARALPNVWRDLGVTGGIGLTALLSMLASMPATTVAGVLGLAPEVIKELVVLTTDMPDDVANQLTNAFASDDCTEAAKDSTAWLQPKDGHTVSPDDITNHWAPPTNHDAEFVHGLYGWNKRIAPRPATLSANSPPQSTWQISQGFGSLEGMVVVRDDDTGQTYSAPGAHVRIGCRHFVAGERGILNEQNLPSGRYWCEASWTDRRTGWVLESEGQTVEVPVGGQLGLHIELVPPPPTRREVLIAGRMDLVNRYAIGEDWWGHPHFAAGPHYVGLDYWPPDPQYNAQREASMTQNGIFISQPVDDWGHAQVKLDLRILPDASVLGTWQARLMSDDDDEWQKTGSVHAPPRGGPGDPPASVVIDLVRSEMAWPVRAHIEFHLLNDRAP